MNAAPITGAVAPPAPPPRTPARRWPKVVGATLGLFIALAVIDRTGRQAPPAWHHGAMLSECDGAIRSVVLQYVEGADNVVPVYRQFLSQLPADVTVYIECPDEAAFASLRANVGLARPLRPVFTGHAMTTWSRDRWVALAPAARGEPTTLLYPRGENGADAWPARAGDQSVAPDLAKALAPAVVASPSDLFFDGGDLLATADDVFVTPAVLQRNLQHTVTSRDELIDRIERALDRHVILLDDAPPHHAGMYMMAVGGRTILVGDPSLARPYVPDRGAAGSDAFPELPGGPDFSAGTQHQFDAVARQVAAAGYRVVRIPTIPSPDGKTYLTFLNAVVDDRPTGRVVYLPQYRGAEPLDAAAAAVWRNLGYTVRPVDCTTVYRSFGTLHCLVNVLDKRPNLN